MKTKRPSLTAAIALSAAFFAACGQAPAGNSSSGSVDPNETAAKVNGKVITMQEVERAVKQESRGQEAKMSPLELAAARLQILQNLVEQEVM
nr:SurA N-terminal domain-containing protein [Pyrinomonadaceae bacterium]